MESVFAVLAIIVIVVAIFAISVYNKLVSMRENVKEAWKSISIALEERLRTVGGVIDAAKKYMEFEGDTLKAITAARSHLQDAVKSGNAKEAASANAQLSSAFQGLNVQVEAYPELKASELMVNAQDSFTQTAKKIASQENYYNGSVREYNKQILVFPNNIFAGIFAFHSESYYEAPEEVQRNVNESDTARSLTF